MPTLPRSDGPAAPTFELPQIPDAPGAPTDRSEGPKFILKDIDVVDVTVLEDDVLEAIAEPYLGRPIGTRDLEQLRRELTRAYVDRGYINSGVVLPDQTIQDGRVVFQAIEGRLTDIIVEPGTRFSADFISDRLARGAGPPLNVSGLEDRLRLLLREPAIERLDAALQPGARPGEATLRAKVTDDRRITVHTGLNNTQSPDVGAERGELSLGFRNLSGYGDLTTLNAGVTEGVLDFDGSFSIPLTKYDTRLAIDVSVSETEIVDEAFQSLDIESDSREASIRLLQPVYKTPTQDLTVFSGFAVRHSRSFLLGQGFSFSPGLDDGEARLSVVSGGIEATDQRENQVIALRTTLSAGIDFLDATDTGVEPHNRFVRWLTQAQYVRRFLGDGELILRGDLQLADGPLFSLERFSIGGMDTVRGYRENLLVRDNGVIASAEVRMPFFRAPLGDTIRGANELVLSAGPFIDYGHGWNTAQANNGVRTISSVGIGLSARAGSRLEAQLYLGKALRHVQFDNDDRQDDGVHFRMRLQLY